MPSTIFSWMFSIVFLILGVLNVILVHPVPGMFYILLSLIYLPLANVLLRRKFGFSIPLAAKVILGLIVLWSTLAITDLADIMGF